MAAVAERRVAAAPRVAFPRSWDFGTLHDTDVLRSVAWVKRGLPASLPGDVATRMGLSKERLYTMLGLARATVERRVREGRPLSPDEGSRVLGLARLVGQVQRMVEQSGRPEGFDAAEWTARWLDRCIPALGGMRPAELMDTAEGQGLVSTLLARAQAGSYT